MIPLDLTTLRDAIASLSEGIAVVCDHDWFNRQSASVQNTLISGVIKNFEFTYELSIKMIRRYLEMHADSPSEIDALDFRDVLRVAAEKSLIVDVEAWFMYRRMRNITAHTYDHEKARQVYQDTQLFLDDAQSLLARIETRNG